MKAADYSYYKLEGLPCRIARDDSHDEGPKAEIYEPGSGFMATSRMEILFEGTPLSKKAFQAMVLSLIQRTKMTD